MRRRDKSRQPVKGRRTLKPEARKAPAAGVSTTNIQKQVTALTRELKEAREQQIATSVVLKVISVSRGELRPVFQATLKNAVRFCGAKFGILFLCEGDGFRTAAMHNVPRAFAEEREREPFLRPPAGSPLGRVMRTKLVAHIADITVEQGYAAGMMALTLLGSWGALQILNRFR